MKEDLVLSPKPEICMANQTMEQQWKVTFFISVWVEMRSYLSSALATLTLILWEMAQLHNFGKKLKQRACNTCSIGILVTL